MNKKAETRRPKRMEIYVSHVTQRRFFDARAFHRFLSFGPIANFSHVADVVLRCEEETACKCMLMARQPGQAGCISHTYSLGGGGFVSQFNKRGIIELCAQIHWALFCSRARLVRGAATF